MPQRRRQLLAWAGTLPWLLATPAHATATPSFGGPAFGSYWRLSGVADDHRRPAIEAAIATVIGAVDRALSPYRADSEISRFNAARSTGWWALTPTAQSVVAAALALARRCDGAFDPTVGPLVGRFGFGPIGGSRHGDHRQLAVDIGAVRKDDPRLTLDLCGIAKGHALDRIVAALDANGLDNYLFELGGEVYARGRHPAGRPWQVAIEDPRPGSSALAHGLALDGLAIATSGNKVHGYEVGGRRIGHIVDPLRSSCVGTALLSVSVAAPQAMLADGLATGMMAMGPQRAADFARRQGLDALLLVREGQGLKTVTSGGFAARLLG